MPLGPLTIPGVLDIGPAIRLSAYLKFTMSSTVKASIYTTLTWVEVYYRHDFLDPSKSDHSRWTL